ncbi:MAG TPA: SDR family oxidoreductase [Pirellulales bacterium]|jgi:thioester reductase-like protein|nr:SDR family oxidoreductase [Pirellulales bacterium]
MNYMLLTGGTGLLGRYLLRDLTLADVPLAVLVRRTRWESAAQRIESIMARWENDLGVALARPVVLEGDIAEPGLGLSADASQWLATNCRSILHSAASLTFQAEEADGEPWRSNVQGTRHVLDVCRQAEIREYHHVSTAYVCGKRRGRILESELDVGQEPGNDYEQSKVTAEKEVLAADGLDRVTVYRPSIIVGDSRTGYTTSYHGFYTPLRVAHSLLQAFPVESIFNGDWLGGIELEGNERKNLVPVEWVSAAIVWLATHEEFHGQTYHLTNPRPTTAMDMKVAISEVLAELVYTGKLNTGKAGGGKPNLAGAGPSEDFLSSFREQMKVYQSYWSDDPEFDSTATERALPHLPCPEITRDVMARLAQFAIDVNFGWPREASIVPTYTVGTQLSKWLPGARNGKSAGGDGGALGDPRGAGQKGTDPAMAGSNVRYVNLQVTGRGGGQWHLVLDRGRLIATGVGLHSGAGPTCYLTSATFARLAQGGLSWEDSINSGRLVVTGNSVHPWELARAFRSLVSPDLATTIL